MSPLIKYPRTRHIQGSRLQQGDEDLQDVPWKQLSGQHLVVEEKVDGANAAISFSSSGELQLQSRGHYLTGGPRERHFNVFKQWAQVHRAWLHERLQDRYILFGEWLYAKHTIFYDQLPHYFMEFDIYDRHCQQFWSTPRRQELLAGGPVCSVRVLSTGPLRQQKQLSSLLGPSAFISAQARSRLLDHADQAQLQTALIAAETDPSPLMEGLYIKQEADGIVQERYKFVRASFLNSVLASGSHWFDRPILPNILRDDVDIFSHA